MERLPNPETFYHGLYVEYFHHNGKVCVMKRKEKEEYTLFDASTPWMSKEVFFNNY